jgi:hypothetical protein
MKKASNFFVTLVTIVVLFQVSRAQLPIIQGPLQLRQVSITEVTNGNYISRDGLYQIGISSPLEDVSGFGFSEGEIRIGYFDFAWDRDDVSFDDFKRWSGFFERDTLANIPGNIQSNYTASNVDPFDSTIYFAFEDGRFGIERHVMRKKRVYVVLAIINRLLDQPLFQRVLDSFGTTGDVDSNILLRNRMDLLTWRPFPQTPTIAGQRNDLADDNLKGPVSKVIKIYRDKQGNKAGIRSITEYDKRGYIFRTIEYDYYGKPHQIEYWGFLDGKRVMKTAAIHEGYSLFKPWVVNKNPKDAPETYDPKLGHDARYWQSQFKRYRAGKLVEKIRYNNDGKILFRSVWEYSGGKVRQTFYPANGIANISQVSQSFDSKGNVVDEIEYRPPSENISPVHLLYRYEYDKYGNWVKKSRCIERNGKCPENTGFSEYREIAYY